MTKLPSDITSVLGDIDEEQLLRLIVRLMPYIIKYIDVYAHSGADGCNLNYTWRQANAYLNERDKERAEGK